MQEEQYKEIREKIAAYGLTDKYVMHIAKYVVKKSVKLLYDSTAPNAKDVRFFGFKTKNANYAFLSKAYWGFIPEPRGDHSLIRIFETRITEENRTLLLMFDFLYEQHPKLLLKNYLTMDKRIETIKKSLKSRKATVEKKAAVTFLKSEQEHIAKIVYSRICNALRRESTNLFTDYYGEELKVQDIAFVFKSIESDNYLLRLQFSSTRNNKIDASGKSLWDCILKVQDYKAMVDYWAKGEDPILRRFALTFLGDNLIGLVDEDPKIRLGSQLRLAGEAK
jgi:hypothetical protein